MRSKNVDLAFAGKKNRLTVIQTIPLHDYLLLKQKSEYFPRVECPWPVLSSTPSIFATCQKFQRLPYLQILGKG
jgi:hypothetical protein